MPVRYDPLLVRALAREIEARWRGVAVRSLALDPRRSAASVQFDDGTALTALLHRDMGFVLRTEADELDGPTVKRTRFGPARLCDVRAPADERALILALVDDSGDAAGGIALELHTNRWNAVALDATADGWRIRYALRTTEVGGRRLGPGEPYEPPRSTRRAIEDPPDRDAWDASLEDGATEPRTTILRTWAWTSALDIAWLLAEGGDPFDRLCELHREAASPGTEAWLVPMRRGPQPYPLALGEPDARRCPSLLEAGALAAEEAGGVTALLERAGAGAGDVDDEGSRLEKRLRDRARRASKRHAALERQLQAAGSPDEAREIGGLLLARKASVPRGARAVTLEGFDGTSVRAELDPALDAVANAERYFQEARRRERARERLPVKIAEAERRVATLEEALRRLDAEGATDALWEIAGGRRPRGTPTRGAPEPTERLPYARLRSSGGLEIRVGRGAKDNDDLTFRHSAPDDIWLHASQTAGAHVVLRWGRRDENPPGRDLREAAVVAAVNSGGRHSGTVPVVWTRRKYVRKPRKSPAGTVVPDRVQTIMVRPDETLVERLREAARDRGH